MSLPHDLRQAFRLIRKAPWFTAASVCVLGLGIGATTAIFSLVDAALLRPLPFREAHQLVTIFERSAQNPRNFVALATFADWRDSTKTLSGVGATAGIIQIPIAKGAEDLPESVPLESVTPSFFTVLGVTPLVGRAPDDSNVFLPGRSDGGVALSERLWRTRFAADLLRLVLGGGLKLTAIGVAIGVAASAALVRSLATLLFGVPPLDPMTFVVAPLSLTVVALLACLAPAIHALRADPVAALRAE